MSSRIAGALFAFVDFPSFPSSPSSPIIPRPRSTPRTPSSLTLRWRTAAANFIQSHATFAPANEMASTSVFSLSATYQHNGRWQSIFAQTIIGYQHPHRLLDCAMTPFYTFLYFARGCPPRAFYIKSLRGTESAVAIYHCLVNSGQCIVMSSAQ